MKASPHRHKWMLSRGVPAAPSDPWNFDASDVSPRQNGQRSCVAALRAADYAAADIIGFVTESSGASDPVTLDLTGAQLAGALAGSRPADYFTSASEEHAVAETSVY